MKLYISIFIVLFTYAEPSYSFSHTIAQERKAIKLELAKKALKNVKGISAGLVALIAGTHGVHQLKSAYDILRAPDITPREKPALTIGFIGSGTVALYITWHALKNFKKSWRQFFKDNSMPIHAVS